MLKKIIVFCSFLFLYELTQAQSSKIDSSQMNTLRIDPENARGASVSQIFDEVEFIPLETTKQSLFGRITQLATTKDRFIIYDIDTKSILIFTKDGKFKTKIDANKIPTSDESRQISNFSGFELKEENSISLIQVRAGKFLIDFNINGELIKKTPLKPEDAAYFFPLYSIPGSATTIKFNQPVREGSDSTHFELVLYKNGIVTANYFPYIKSIKYKDYIGRFGDNIFNNGEENTLYYVGWPGDLNIYKILPNKVILSYQLILPEKNSLPLDFNDNPTYIGNKQTYLRSNEAKFYQIGNVYKIANYLFFNLLNSSAGKKSFLYNLKNKTLISINNLQPDQLSSFLPISDGVYDYYGFHLFKDGYLYNSYSSLSMFDFMNQRKNKSPKYNKVLEEYFKTQNRKSNPVIIKLKPKMN